MIRSILYLFLRRVLGLLRSDQRMASEVELENVVLRHELVILRRPAVDRFVDIDVATGVVRPIAAAR